MQTVEAEGPLRVLIHAPTEGALRRARSNARNVRRHRPQATVEIVANADGVAAALAEPDAEADAVTALCGVTLERLGQTAPPEQRVVESAAVHVAERQRQGWAYLRA